MGVGGELTMDQPMGLRQRKRLEAMRRIQATALDLVEARSFDDVRIDQIATAAGTSESSVYRYFGTKEGVFLWDEHDASAFELLEHNLATMQPLDALKAAFHATLAGQVGADDEHMLRKLDLIYREPALTAAMAQLNDQFRHETAGMLAAANGRTEPNLDDQVASAAIIGAMSAAIEEFVRCRARTPLTVLFDEATAVLARGLTLSD